MSGLVLFSFYEYPSGLKNHVIVEKENYTKHILIRFFLSLAVIAFTALWTCIQLNYQYITMGQGQARSAESKQFKSSTDQKEELKSTKNPENQARSSETVSLLSKCREKKRERWGRWGGGAGGGGETQKQNREIGIERRE